MPAVPEFRGILSPGLRPVSGVGGGMTMNGITWPVSYWKYAFREGKVEVFTIADKRYPSLLRGAKRLTIAMAGFIQQDFQPFDGVNKGFLGPAPGPIVVILIPGALMATCANSHIDGYDYDWEADGVGHWYLTVTGNFIFTDFGGNPA